MHIVHLSTRLDYYGGEVCLANLARGFADRGHQVSCLVRPGSALEHRLAGGLVTVAALPMVDWFDPGTVRRVARWLRRHPVDILASHLPRDYFIAAVASHGLPICNIATRHHLKPVSWPFLKRPFLRRFGAVVAVSEAVAQGVRQARLVPPERVVTVTNGIVPPRDSGTQPGLRCRVGVAAGVPVIGFVGKCCPEKGLDVLLQSAGSLVSRFPSLQVFVVGSGGETNGYRARLIHLADQLGLAGQVHFFGYVPEAVRYIREFDVQVVSAEAEPFGLVTLEAMASGVPVIVTATGGSPEIVRDGIEGFLVPPRDTVAIANRLGCLLDSPGLRNQMGLRGQERFAAHFTIEEMLDKTEAVYHRALSGTVGGRR